MENHNYNIDAIGVGALFPIQLSQNYQGQVGWYPVEGDPSLIENNLRSLVEYLIGQRIRQEEFGTRLWECLEEPNTQALSFMIKEFLKQAIGEYETRISINKITTIRDFTSIHIIMEYTLVGKVSTMELTFNP